MDKFFFRHAWAGFLTGTRCCVSLPLGRPDTSADVIVVRAAPPVRSKPSETGWAADDVLPVIIVVVVVVSSARLMTYAASYTTGRQHTLGHHSAVHQHWRVCFTVAVSHNSLLKAKRVHTCLLTYLLSYFVKTHLTVTKRRLPYVITQCCLSTEVNASRLNPSLTGR